MRKVALPLVLAHASCLLVLAQELPLPGTEALPSVFATQLGSPDVQLLLSGTWQSQMTESLGWTFDSTPGEPIGPLSSAAFPTMTQGFAFTQQPDLTVSLQLLDRYFLKASFLDSTLQTPGPTLPLDLNTFELGYNGKPGEFLQSVRVGNTDTNMGQYGFVKFPDAPRNSIGISARFGTDTATYEAMLRYEPENFQTKTFIGNSELTEQQTNPGAYLDGRFFYLPDANVTGVQVFMEDGSGTIKGSDGHWYRPATTSDVVISSSQGYVFFTKTLPGRAVVYYTVNGSPVGSPGLGAGFLPPTDASGAIDPNGTPVNFNWNTAYRVPGQTTTTALSSLQVTVSGLPGLLISQPGVFSPFEACDTYSLPQGYSGTSPRIYVLLVPKGSENGVAIPAQANPSAGTVTVLGPPGDTGSAAPNPRSIAARFPFAATFPDIYSAGVGREPADLDQEILVQVLSSVSGYQLDTDVLPGSVSVLRNGVEEDRFSVDYTSGLLTFTVDIAATDLIVINYRTTDAQGQGGDLLLGLGANFDLLPTVGLDVGAGLQWAAFTQAYTDVQGTATGSAIIGVGLNYTTTNLKAQIRTGFSLSSPDTTGEFRLFGMEDSGSTLSITDQNELPSSAPPLSEDAALGNPVGSFSQATRGELFYKDYNSYGSTSTALESIDWAIPSNQIYPYTNGSRIGPYPVWDSNYGMVMVMDYALTSTQNWVGAQIPIPSAPQDLTDVTDLTFSLSSMATSGTVTAYIQIGAISEDLEGSGILESSSSTNSMEFPFHQGTMVLYVGGGAGQGQLDTPATTTASASTGIATFTGVGAGSGGTGNFTSTTTPTSAAGITPVSVYSEDMNGNGILDQENASLVVTKPLSVPAAGSGWQTVDIPLTASDRALLTAASFVRIIIVASAGSSASGKLLITNITFAGSPFHVATTAEATGSAEEVGDPQPPGAQLTDRYPEVNTIFHPDGQINKVLEVNWNNTTSQDAVTLTGYPPPVTPGNYKDLCFYLLQPAGVSEALAINLVDSVKLGIHLTFTPGSPGVWHKYSIDLLGNQLLEDGAAIGGATVTVDSGASQLATMTMTVSGAGAGTFYIDEVHFENSVIQAAFGADLKVDYSRPGVLFSARGVPLVSNLTIHEQAAASGAGFASGFTSSQDVPTASTSTQVGADLAFVNFSGSFGYDWTSDYTTISGGHSVRVPLGLVTFGDTYTQSVAESGAGNAPQAGALASVAGGAETTTPVSSPASVALPTSGISFAHGTTAALVLPSVASINFTDTSSTLAGGLSQVWNGTLNSQLHAPVSLNVTTELQNTVATFNPYSADYFANWADSFQLLGLYSDPLEERIGNATVDLLWQGKGIGAEIKQQASYDSSVSDARYQANTGTTSLSLPITIGSGGPLAFQLAPVYSRAVGTTLYTPDDVALTDDLSSYGAGLATMPVAATAIPLVELFDNATNVNFTNETNGLLAASYTPELSLQANRTPGSHLSDLFVPSYLMVSLERALERQADTVNDTLSWEVDVRTDALNLFGRQGVYHLFPFYNTEELSETVDVKDSIQSSEIGDQGSAFVENTLTFYGDQKAQLSFDNRLTYAWGTIVGFSDNLVSSFVWHSSVSPTFLVPGFPAQIQKGMYLEHTESLTIASEPDVIVNSFQLTATHESALVFTKYGKIAATLGFGIQTNEIAVDETSYLFGLTFGIEGKLSF